MRVPIERLQDLAQRIRQIEANGRAQGPTSIPLGMTALAEIFPQGRLPGGSLLELLSGAEGTGVWTLALLLAGQACGAQKALVIADAQQSFYPPAATTWGIDLERAVVVRPRTGREAAGAAVQALRCPAVGAVIGWFERIATAEFRALQLAAEAGGGVGLLLRPAAVQGTPSLATGRLLVSPLPSSGERRRLHVEVLRFRGGKPGKKLTLEIDDETRSLRVSAALATAKIAARLAGAR